MNYQKIILQGYLKYKHEPSAFVEYFESEAQEAEKISIKNDRFYKDCMKEIEKYKDEVVYQYESVIKSELGVPDTLESEAYKTDYFFYWCGVTKEGEITHDIFAIEHKLYYPILEKMRQSVELLLNRLPKDSIEDIATSHRNIGEASKGSDTNKMSLHKYNTILISKVYEFCLETAVLGQSISYSDYIIAIENADFKILLEKCYEIGSATKFKRIIPKLSEHFGKDWYRKAAHSIDDEPTNLSGLNVPKDWLEKLNAIK